MAKKKGYMAKKKGHAVSVRLGGALVGLVDQAAEVQGDRTRAGYVHRVVLRQLREDTRRLTKLTEEALSELRQASNDATVMLEVWLDEDEAGLLDTVLANRAVTGWTRSSYIRRACLTQATNDLASEARESA